MAEFDLVVVGGGPGGYPGALMAAERGLRVALVEAEQLGGECTNYGCIPSKALLAAVAALHEVERWGGRAELDPGELARRVWGLVERLRGGIRFLLEKRGVTIIHGRARLTGSRSVRVELAGGGVEVYNAGKILLAPGSSPWAPPPLRVPGVLDNRGALRLVGEPPDSVLIVGGGPVGVELAQVYRLLGSRVVLVELLPRILPGMDRGISAYMARLLRRLGVEVYTGCSVERVEPRGGGFEARYCGRVEVFGAVIAATGRRPRTSGLGLGEAGVRVDDKGFITVDEYMETSASGVYAAGDAAGPPMLAHKAIHQSIVAGVNAAGGREKYEGRLVPVVVYGLVEAAEVGYRTAREAAEAGFEAGEARVRLGSVSYAAVAGAEDGFARIVYDRESRRLLGFVAAAPHASDLAAAAATAIAAGLTVDEASRIVYPHPSASEALIEALLQAAGKPLHYLATGRR